MPTRTPSTSSQPSIVIGSSYCDDLVVLRHVGIEVVLAREDRLLGHAQVQRLGDAQRVLDRPLVEHRQRPGQPEAHRADVGVRLVAELVGAAAEQLARGRQLAVHLEPDDRSPTCASRSRSCRPSRCGLLDRARHAEHHRLAAAPARAPARRSATPARPPVAERHRHRGVAGQVRRDRAHVAEVHRERVGGLRARARTRPSATSARAARRTARTRASKSRMISVRTRCAWP